MKTQAKNEMSILHTMNKARAIGWLLCAFVGVSICAADVQLLSGQVPPVPGTVDSTFQPPVDCDAPLNIAVQSDGRLLVAADFYNFQIPGVTNCARLLRIDRDGAYDPTFAPLTTNCYVSSEFTAMALQADGKVLVTTQWGQGRLNPDGTWDSSFLRLQVPSSPCYSYFWGTALVFQPDGKLLGSGRRYVRAECSGDDPYWENPELYRWLHNGDLDDSFTQNGSSGENVGTFVVLTNNQILVGGNSLTLLHSDGTKDTNFVAGPFLPVRDAIHSQPRIQCCAIQPDGRFLVGGLFTNVQGQARSHLARILPDGHLDTSFNPPTMTGAAVKVVAVQTDGRILVGGEFETIDGLPYGSLARLNPDGSLDATFASTQDLTDGGVDTLLIQDETHALVGGGYGDDVEPPLPGHLFRIHLGEPAPRLSIHQDTDGVCHVTYPYSGSYDFAVACATNLTLPASNWTVLGSATNAGAGLYRFTDRVAHSPTQRFYKLQGSGTP